jgi:selenocysteine-specific elongation factor
MILATAGHIDHGKTALVRALTGVDADRLPEEKRRGMTIDLGFAYANLPDGSEIGFVDVPGHERFLPNMLAGVLSIDRVLLVVAADDGPRPQTLEHLDILDLIGVGEVTGVVTKIDRVEAARTEAVVAELHELLAAAGFADSPIFPVSSRTGAGITRLIGHLEACARDAARRRNAAVAPGLFRMPIDRAFTLPGVGLVVTGTVAAGVLAVGDRLAAGSGGTAARVRGLHAQNRPVAGAMAGDRVAVNLAGAFADGKEPGRGDWLLAPSLHTPVGRLDLRLRMSRFAAAPLRDGLPVHVHLGTADLVGRAAVLGARTLAPGDTGFVQLELDHPVGALWGDRVVLRDHASRRTLGGGRVVDPFPRRRGRSRPERLAALSAMAEGDAAAALRRLLETEGLVDLARWALSRNLRPDELDAAVAAIVDGERFLVAGPARERVAMAAERLTALSERLLERLAEWHRAQPDGLGPTRPALIAQLRGEMPAAAIDRALAALAEAGRVAREGGLWRLSEHRPRLAPADERLWERVRPLLAEGELRPPRVRELAPALALEPEAVERFLNRAERFGRVAKVADNRFFLPETLVRLADIARELAEATSEGAFTAQNFKDRSGVGRNLTIQILEYLDRIGVTRRVGDARVVLRRGEEVLG